MPGCCVPGCGNSDKTRMPFHALPKNEKLRNLWLEKIRKPELSDKPETTLNHLRVCSVHFEDKQYRAANRQKLNIGAYPALFLPANQEVDVRECVKGFVPDICNNDTTDNSKESSKPVESNETDLEIKSEKIIEEPEVTPAPILFVASSTDYKEEEVLTTNDKQTQTDCEASMKIERNGNLVINKNTALQKRVNLLEIQNRRLDRRVQSMKMLLRHYKNMHTR